MSEKSIDELRAVPLKTESEMLRKQAKDMAQCYGIPFFIRNGRIHQHGPGEEIVPGRRATPQPFGELPGKPV